jgi:HEAT repeat protein
MIVSQNEIRSRIEQLRLNYDGYRRQLARLEPSGERRERLERDVQLLGDEIATLEKIAQVGRVEPDRARIEEIVRERLAVLHERFSTDPTTAHLTAQEQELTSGEARALLWTLREDTLTRYSDELAKGRTPDPARTDRAMPTILMHTLRNGPNIDARASAAYDLGKLHIPEAIPALADALGDDPLVARMALGALARFSDDELTAAGTAPAIVEQVRAARGS